MSEESDERWALIRAKTDILDQVIASEQRLMARLDRLEILLTEIAEAFTDE